MSLGEPLRQQISDLVTTNRVVLFMTGTRRMPQCGYSAQVVRILDELLPSYETVDVLRSPEMRDGIKAFEAAVAEAGGDSPHLQIDAQYHHGLFFRTARTGVTCVRRLLLGAKTP